MTTSEISDQRSPDSIKIGRWLFQHRTAVPVPFAAALLLLRAGESPFSWTLVGAGVILTVAGEAIRLWAVHHIGAISRTRSGRLGPLVEAGPFGLVRNPLYVGNVLLWVGFTLTARLVWLAPVVLGLLAAEYHAIVKWEEQLLESRFGVAYRNYAARVPRWMPRLSSRDNLPGRVAPTLRSDRGPTSNVDEGRGTSGTFSWRETIFSERGTLIAIAAAYALLWLKARF
jgi:protein-S-isoprenylcysteine O-methyltransferase Ste14